MSEDEETRLPMVQVLAYCALTLAIVGTFLLALYGYAPLHEKRPMLLRIRVRNETGFLLQDVKVNGAQFGDIAADATTPYVRSTYAYAVPALHYSLSGVPSDLVPDDRVGDDPPEEGDFTYTLRMDSPQAPTSVLAILGR